MQEDELKREQLKGSQWNWRKNPQGHTEKQLEQLHMMNWQSLRTAMAYQMRLILQDIYKLRSQRQAREQLQSWSQWVKETARRRGGHLLEPMVKVAEMVRSHLEGILGHWKED